MTVSRRAVLLAAVVGVAACAPASSPCRSGAGSAGSVVLTGRIVTMDEPAEVEALLIEDGTVTAVGRRDEVLARACDQMPAIDIGQNVAYPGFIDAHAHWIGDRRYYGVETPAEAMEAAASRGWTSISEQWVDPERVAELESLAAEGALGVRVDGYLRLNDPQIGGAHYDGWYADREPGPVDDWLRVRGLKIHLDTGFALDLLWEADELTEAVVAANEAGWQVAIHAFSDEAHELALDAFEAAIGPDGPNPLHHRVEHAIQVTDPQLERMVAMDIAIVGHLDSVSVDWVSGPTWQADLGAEDAWFARWKDFVNAGIHFAGATDAPWIFPGYPDFVLTDDIARPVDQIAGGTDPIGRYDHEPPAWTANQLLTAEQGLAAVTTGAAWALGDEALRGHLAVGTWGDVTILSGDVTAGTADDIRALDVVATVVGGSTVFCADPAFCP
jgi:predicted amidohydrolase YtcJ